MTLYAHNGITFDPFYFLNPSCSVGLGSQDDDLTSFAPEALMLPQTRTFSITAFSHPSRHEPTHRR